MKSLLAIALLFGTASAGPPGHALWVASVFPPTGGIPRTFTCDGAERAPPLVWSGTPDDTRTFAIIVRDAEAAQDNWVIEVPANINAIEGAPEDAVIGQDWDPP